MTNDIESNSIVTVQKVPPTSTHRSADKIPPRSYYMLSMINQKAFTNEEIVSLVENAVAQAIGAGCAAKLVKLRDQK